LLSICVVLFSFLPFFYSPADSVDIFITNNLSSTSIVDMYYLINGQSTLHKISIPFSLQPDSTLSITLPSLLLNRIVFEDENMDVYFASHYPASSSGDTLTVSLANKEFGGIFERIYGDRQLVIGNSTDVQIVSIFFTEFPQSCEDILRNNVLLPSELLRVWIDSGVAVEVTTVDRAGNRSIPFTSSAATPDSVYRITPEMFFNNGEEFGYSDSQAGSWVVNSITLGRIVLVEAFSSDGFLLDGLDCSSSPLTTWDRVNIHHNTPIGFVVLTDENGRTFSANAVDSLTGSFILGDLNLDFGFEFP